MVKVRKGTGGVLKVLESGENRGRETRKIIANLKRIQPYTEEELKRTILTIYTFNKTELLAVANNEMCNVFERTVAAIMFKTNGDKDSKALDRILKMALKSYGALKVEHTFNGQAPPQNFTTTDPVEAARLYQDALNK